MKIKIKKTSHEDKNPVQTKFPSIEKKKILEDKSGGNSLVYLGYFLAIVAVFVFFGIVARFIFTYQKSTFSTDSYSVLVDDKLPFIISYDNVLKKLTYVNVESYKPQNRMKASLLMGVPIDGIVTSSIAFSPDNFLKFSSIFRLLLDKSRSKFQNLTLIDVSKLVLDGTSVPRSEINHEKIAIYKNKEISGLSSDELYDTFKDSNVIEEALSLEVVNATVVEGLAGSVSHVLKNIGGNVISVSSLEESPSSAILATKMSKTVVRISHILGIKPRIVKKLASQADIKIVLGKDFAQEIK